MNADLQTAVEATLQNGRALIVSRLAKATGQDQREVGMQLAKWTAERELRDCDKDGGYSRHTHTYFMGNVYGR